MLHNVLNFNSVCASFKYLYFTRVVLSLVSFHFATCQRGKLCFYSTTTTKPAST